MNALDLYAPPHELAARELLATARQLARQLAYSLERQGFVVADAMRAARATLNRRMPGTPPELINAEVSTVYAIIGARRAVEPAGRPILFDMDLSGEPLSVEHPCSPGKVVVICYDASCEVNRAARLARFVGGRWLRRYKGYVMSRSQARRVESMSVISRSVVSCTPPSSRELWRQIIPAQVPAWHRPNLGRADTLPTESSTR